MSTQTLQDLTLVLILLASLVIALRHLLPNGFRRMQGGIARVLSRPRHGALVRRWGRWLQPAEAKKGQCGSGLGCASCSGCGTASPNPAASNPLKFNSGTTGRTG